MSSLVLTLAQWNACPLAQNVTGVASNLANCCVAAHAEEGGGKSAGGSKEAPPPAAPAFGAAKEAAGGDRRHLTSAVDTPRQASLSLAPSSAVTDACHRADVAATLYQLLSNGLLTHHEMDSIYAMLAGLCPDTHESGFGGDGAGTWLAGALLRLKGRETAVLGSVMDRVFEERHEYLPVLRSAYDFEVSQPATRDRKSVV